MTRKEQRIYAILLVLGGAVLAVGLSLFALRDTVTFFYTPTDVISGRIHTREKPIKLGGLVMYGTTEKNGAITSFVVTDNVNDITVFYEGILPALFREGQGVVAQGRMSDDGTFKAGQLLAKHDENYMPPEVARALLDSTLPPLEEK